MKLGNIVSSAPVDVPEDFNVVKSINDVIDGIPTLIIGWDYIKKKYPDYDIITKKIDNTTYWTFKRTEKRDLYEEDLYNFIKNTYNELIKDVVYVFIDPILSKKSKIKKILKKINSSDRVVSYINKDMVYINVENIIFGVSLSLCEFIGLNIDKIIYKIEKKSDVFLKHDDIFIEYKKTVDILDNQFKYIPFLYSIKHG